MHSYCSTVVLVASLFILTAETNAQYQASTADEYRVLMAMSVESLVADHRIAEMISSTCPSVCWISVDSTYACRRSGALDDDLMSERGCAILILARALNLRPTMSDGNLDYRWLNRDLMLGKVSEFVADVDVPHAPLEAGTCEQRSDGKYLHKGYLDYWVRARLLECLTEFATTSADKRKALMERFRLILSVCVYEQLAGVDCR